MLLGLLPDRWLLLLLPLSLLLGLLPDRLLLLLLPLSLLHLLWPDCLLLLMLLHVLRPEQLHVLLLPPAAAAEAAEAEAAEAHLVLAVAPQGPTCRARPDCQSETRK